MIDIDKIDSLFNEDARKKDETEKDALLRHSVWVRRAKLLLPSIAAVLIGLLILLPSFSNDEKEFYLDITRPRKGELEKLHVEKTVFNITDKDNKVHNFTADNIDETAPGSKLIKLTNPDGVMPTAENDWVNIKAPTGYYNQSTNQLQLTDNVEVFYSEGMNIKTPNATFDFAASKAFGNRPVTAQGYIGDLDSQGFEFYNKTGIIVFTGKTHIKFKEESLKGKQDE